MFQIFYTQNYLIFVLLIFLRASLVCFKTDEITVSHLVTFEHFFNESPFVDVWVKT